MILEDQSKLKMRAIDRIFVLKKIEGKSTVNSSGLVDHNLFTGGNRLHALQDPFTTMWSLRYDSGTLPPQLKQKFTSFAYLKNYVAEYFNKRNIEIAEVQD